MLLSLFMATTGLLASAAAVVLFRGPATPPSQELATAAAPGPTASAPSPAAHAPTEAVEVAEPKPPASTETVTPTADSVDPTPPEAADPSPPKQPPLIDPTAGPAAERQRVEDIDGETLDDATLVSLFALETRRTLPACQQLLGADSHKYTGTNPRQSVAQLKAARRAMVKGQGEAARKLLCGSAAHDPTNIDAHRSLAELALQTGDPEQARLAVESGLKTAPDDRLLLGLLGDSLALMGDLPASRAAWLRTLPDEDPQRASHQLAGSYSRLGRSAAASSSYGHALAFHRRALILTEGGYAASLGVSEALIWLGHEQAALVWAKRAAKAFPKDSRVQVLFGDALYKNEQLTAANAAWRTALELRPGNRAAKRRLKRGKP
jgi:tetratricopeptide (TPR) repeat protein